MILTVLGCRRRADTYDDNATAVAHTAAGKRKQQDRGQSA